jgi:3-oxoacyl-[acyl-carrier protein] reductase
MGLEKFSLKGRTALVTGAASKRGIGRAISIALAGAGADVAVCDVNAAGGDFDLEGTASELRALGVHSFALTADISSKADVTGMVDRVVKKFGRLDILVNNAGVAGIFPFFSDNDDLWDKVMDVNLKGCFLCSKAAAAVMIRQKSGSIINIASGAGLRWFPDSSVYGMSKAGIIQFTRWLARELGPSNVRVNAIAPTPVNTDIDNHRIDSKKTEDIMEVKKGGLDVASRIPLGRIAEPDDIADIALFLAGDAARYVTGQIIVADGGMMLAGF